MLLRVIYKLIVNNIDAYFMIFVWLWLCNKYITKLPAIMALPLKNKKGDKD